VVPDADRLRGVNQWLYVSVRTYPASMFLRREVQLHPPTNQSPPARPGLMARLGSWTATHLRAVLVGWAVMLVVFGFFAPRVQSALAGAGWQDSTSQSVAARNLIQRGLQGLGASALQVAIVDHQAPISSDPGGQAVTARVTALLRADPRVSTVVTQPGVSPSADGRTGITTAGAAADPNAMVNAAEHLAGPISRTASGGVTAT
jgi:RND superfamily putative drug exporter